jgi:hypothetical protein
MDFSSIIDSFVSYAQGHPALVIALVLCWFLLLYRRPKLFVGLLLFVVFLAAIYYAIMNLASTGSERKKGLLSDEEKQTESNR